MSLAMKSLQISQYLKFTIQEKIYSSFPYISRVKLGERIYNGFNRSQLKICGASLKTSRHLGSHPGLPYFEAGNPQNPTLLFLHGFGDTKESYLKQALYFKKDYHVIVPDMPGFGPNPRLTDFYYNAQSMAEVALSFIEDLKLENVHLNGNSMGGAISAHLALIAGDKIISLSLIDTAGFYFDHVHSVLDEFLDGYNLFLVDSPNDYNKLLGRVFNKVPFVPRPVFEFLYEKIRQEKAWYEKMVHDLTHGLDTIEKAHEDGLFLNHHINDLKIPVQLLWGDKDSLFPLQTAKEIKKLAPQVELHILENCGHAPHYEKAKQLNKLLNNFYQKN